MALPPHQVGVWIPKAKMGREADCFRALGMPNTLDRLVDGSVAHAMSQTAHMMHPSQAVMSYFKEPQKAVSCIQRILDGDDSANTLLARVSHKVQSRLLARRTILQGVYMGRSFSVYLFCLAMDPLFHLLKSDPRSDLSARIR